MNELEPSAPSLCFTLGLAQRLVAELSFAGWLRTYPGYRPEACAVLFYRRFPGSDGPDGHVALRVGGVELVRLGPDGAASFHGGYAPDGASRALWALIARCNPHIDPAPEASAPNN